MKTAMYVRISRDIEGTGLGVERQRKDCEAVATSLGQAVEVYEDNDVSAYSGKVRPSYERMLSEIAGGQITAVVAWHPDRLHRQSKELERYIEIAGAIPTYTVNGGSLDLTTPAGRAVAKTVGAWAQYESEQKALRLLSKHAELRESGRMVGTSAFGWKMTPEGRLSPELEPIEAGMLRDAARAVVEGAGLYNVARQWNADGFKTRRGGPWTHGNLRLALLNPRMAGLRAHKRQVVTDADGKPVVGQWEPILSVEEWQRVCAVIHAKKRTRIGSTKHVLGGLMTCECGGTMYGSTGADYRTKRTVTTYRCGSCTCAINTDKAESVVVSAVVSSLLFGESAPESTDGTHTAQEARLSDLQASDARLLDLAMAGVYTAQETASRRAAILAEIAAVRQEIACASADSTYTATVREIRATLMKGHKINLMDAVKAKETLTAAFDDLDMDRQRALIKGSVSVTVHRGRGSDRVKPWHLIATSLNDSESAA